MTKGDSMIPIKAVGLWTAEQHATLSTLLDMMIPASADGRMPAASSLGLFDSKNGVAQDAQAKDVHAALVAGLKEVDAAANSQFGKTLAMLNGHDAKRLIDELRSRAAPFFDLLTQQTLARYYGHTQVLTALGVEPAAPWPGGHSVDDGDWTLLDGVRTRAPMYRNS